MQMKQTRYLKKKKKKKKKKKPSLQRLTRHPNFKTRGLEDFMGTDNFQHT